MDTGRVILKRLHRGSTDDDPNKPKLRIFKTIIIW